MGQLFTVDSGNDSKELVPVTLDAFRADLANQTTRVYVYVGQETDPGWKAALSVAGLLADLNPYLATDIALLREWVPGGNPRGIVFGTADKPNRLLDATEAAASKTVHQANSEAP
jgi:hypothetical protein